MLISDNYRALNRQLHESNPHYGTTAKRYVEPVEQFAAAIKADTILDYGCGKGLLQQGLVRKIEQYDPCIPGKENPPAPADLVVSIDVMEHIEPDCLEGVLDDIQRLSRKAVFLTVATRNAAKTLADGRNAHLIVQPLVWWLPKLTQRWEMVLVQANEAEFLFVGSTKAEPVVLAA